ncbi:MULTISPECIES: Rv2175c family DNA-binding protein [Kocuria]|uniref:Transcriptional regulator n=1 Tax=Kocuria turfanensis TaxID=388357 RepID=A0A512IE66_9MICC|nr:MULTISPECIES: Rv2175c family DNA-binding protein [Kocuria]GEO95990.1 transcriptional regulator [Kocuria turfanensis]
MKKTSGNSTEEFDRLDGLVQDWLPLPDVAEQLGLVVTRVHGLVDDGTLLAVRNPHDNIRRIPAAFLLDGAVLDSLKGTVAVLRDSGFTDAEAIAWLFTEDESLPGRPVDALRDGRKTEIRRRAQALAW